MLEVMETRIRNETYNVGYKEVIDLYSQVAARPDYYIDLAERISHADETQRIFEKPNKHGTVVETWEAMDYLIEHRNAWICTEHSGYKAIPRGEAPEIRRPLESTLLLRCQQRRPSLCSEIRWGLKPFERRRDSHFQLH